MCIRKISGTIEPLWGESTGELTGAFCVGDITHRHGSIRFDEMRICPVRVQPCTMYRLEPEAETIRLPEIKKYGEE